MPELLTLEFEGLGQREYEAVNRELNIDMSTGEGEWPDGLLTHAAGTADSGAFVVSEVWSSREAQSAFMEASLGAALAAAGVTVVPSVTWGRLVTHLTPGA